MYPRNASSTLLNQSRSAKPARIVTLSPSPADFRTPTSAQSNLHSARQPSHPISRAFLHCRLSDDGPGASRIVAMGRHPKPFTNSEVVASITSFSVAGCRARAANRTTGPVSLKTPRDFERPSPWPDRRRRASSRPCGGVLDNRGNIRDRRVSTRLELQPACLR